MSDIVLATSLETLSELSQDSHVTLSHGLVTLLSEQLYKSPLKAIEELVVNSYDADATQCWLSLASPTTLLDPATSFIAVLDDGKGMDAEGLVNLWCIGRSLKRDSAYKKRFSRTQIGKFGIGKLASYSVAHRLTYISKTAAGTLAVTIDFRAFSEADSGTPSDVRLPIRRIDDWPAFAQNPRLKAVIDGAKLPTEFFQKSTWTIALLEELKPKAAEIKQGRLSWVLSTAMPLQTDFSVYLNGAKIASAKETYSKIVSFDVSDLSAKRLTALKESTSEAWEIADGMLKSESYPRGISGSVYVCDRSLRGKSDDLGRSYGFFIRVRGRLLNEDDPLFGLDPLSHQTFNCFRCDLNVDDLDAYLLSSREEIEAASIQRSLKAVMEHLFNEARQRRDDYYEGLFKKEQTKREGQRPFIEPRLVERPIADVIAAATSIRKGGTEADDGWFYLQVDESVDGNELMRQLYDTTRKSYRYEYESVGRSGRIVKLNISDRTFTLNSDHEYVRAHQDDGRARRVLEDCVTAEALLEVYLREANIMPHIVGDILERRDSLLRGLAKDHVLSMSAIARELRDAASDQYLLEISLVRAARALGFVAKHISGEGEPDGIARLVDYPDGERTITLEAKSSTSVPQLGAIDFAGLGEHVEHHQTNGCLLVSPSYPGQSKGNESAASSRSNALKISCWTIEQLARVVENAEQRHITADDVLNIVLTKFTPDDVTAAIEQLLADPVGDMTELYNAILRELRSLEGKARTSQRSVDLLLGRLVDKPGLEALTEDRLKRALAQIAGASKGTVQFSGNGIRVLASLDEIQRRLSGILGTPGAPRGRGPFRQDSAGEEI